MAAVGRAWQERELGPCGDSSLGSRDGDTDASKPPHPHSCLCHKPRPCSPSSSFSAHTSFPLPETGLCPCERPGLVPGVVGGDTHRVGKPPHHGRGRASKAPKLSPELQQPGPQTLRGHHQHHLHPRGSQTPKSSVRGCRGSGWNPCTGVRRPGPAGDWAGYHPLYLDGPAGASKGSL